MHISIQSVDVCTIQAIIMVATDENFVVIWQIAEPVQEINSLSFRTGHAEVAGVYHDISCRELLQPPVATMCVR